MSSLFQPIKLGTLELKNRILMAPMTRSFSPGHVVSDKSVAYYRRRAENQVGLIITEGTCVGHKAANGYPNVPFISGEESLQGWQKVFEAVHLAGGKIVPQLWHVGGVRKSCLQPDESVPAYSPSGLLSPNKENGVVMSQGDIDEVIAAFVQAAVDAKNIGADGIEIHGAHGYLLDQFFWGKTNLRTDKYGGDLIQRTTFAVEMIKEIRQAVGAQFPIILRYSQWKLQNYKARLAETLEQLKAFLLPLVDAGIDIFHCSTRRFWQAEFAGSDLNLAAWTKKLTGKPVITVGSIGLDSSFVDDKTRSITTGSSLNISHLEKLEQSVKQGEYDLVAIGRCLLQDPKWVTKLKAKEYKTMKNYSAESLKTLY